MNGRYLFTLVLLIGIASPLLAQVSIGEIEGDSPPAKVDTPKTKPPVSIIHSVPDETPADSGQTTVSIQTKPHSPGKAALFSAVLPGLGQAYNQKYWKIPIIYAGFGGLGYALYYNGSRYRGYRNAYILQVDGDSTTTGSYNGITNPSSLKTLWQFYRSNRDLAIVGTLAWYALQIIDATVDAHLFSFDVSDDLSMRIEPNIDLMPNQSVYSATNHGKVSLKISLSL